MIPSSLLAGLIRCDGNGHTAQTFEDINHDGIKDVVGKIWDDCDSPTSSYVQFGGQSFFRMNTEDGLEMTDNIMFTVWDQGFPFAASLEATRFHVGQDVRLLDGRAVHIQSVHFIFDDHWKLTDTRAEVVVDSLPHSFDVYLSELQPRWEPKAKK